MPTISFSAADCPGFSAPGGGPVRFDASLEVVRTNGLEFSYLRPVAFCDLSTLSVWTKECPVSVAIAKRI